MKSREAVESHAEPKRLKRRAAYRFVYRHDSPELKHNANYMPLRLGGLPPYNSALCLNSGRLADCVLRNGKPAIRTVERLTGEEWSSELLGKPKSRRGKAAESG